MADIINISYADVTLGGTAGISALGTYNIGAGGTLRIQATVNLSVGSVINFTGPRSHLVLAGGLSPNLLGTINGFGPGSNIDVNAASVSYTYSDNAGNDTGGTLTLRDVNNNTVQTVALNTGDFTASSFNVHPDGNGGTLIDFATYVSTITATPSTADLTTGGNVVLQLTTTAPVTISGSPRLTLSDGGFATYDSASSTSTSLVFRHTVLANENTPDLTVTGTDLNGATITDLIGNAVDLAGGANNPAGILQVDTTAPTIASVTTSPGSGDLTAGQLVTINVTPSEAVTVTGGTPTLALSGGGIAAYDSASSSPTLLVFKYVVQPGQNTADLAVTGTNLSGATIVDGAGNSANLSGAMVNPAGTLQIDTTPPTFSNVTTSPNNGAVIAGQIVAINVAPNEAVTVTGGTPTLTLNDGGIATYDAASSTPTFLVFKYTVQPGQNVADLAVTSTNLNGATIADLAGNAGDLSSAAVNPAGILQVDTMAPTVLSVTTAPGSGAFAAGQTISFNVTASDAVTVAGGTPSLTLNDGGVATYDAASSTPTNLVFKYTVQPGQNIADLAVTATNLNGATVADPAGNPLGLSAAAVNPAGILQIDTTAPTVASVTTTPGGGALAAGQIVSINVTPSEAVTVAGGTPTLTLNDGGIATYDPATSTPTLLVFKYTVLPGENIADLAITGSNLHNATISDPAGNPLNLSGVIGNPPGVLQINTTPPIVASVTTSPGSGFLAAGQIVSINVTPSEAVTVAGGPPTLTLDDGGTATYDAASSTSTLLVFKYTVLAGDNTGDLNVTGANLNGATITDAAGNLGNLSGAVGNPPGILQIDTTPPTIVTVTTSPSSGSLAEGQVVSFNVTPSEAVAVNGGTPTLILNDGGVATYDAANSTSTLLIFKYVVGAGQNIPDLAVSGTSLNGATITDRAGNPADLSGAVVNPPGVLQIDTTRPAVFSVYDVTTTQASNDLTTGANVTFQVTLTGIATVTGGTPALTLSDGGTATYDPGSSSLTSLVFQHTVQPGQNTPDLSVTGVMLNGAMITDIYGHPIDMSGAVVNPPGIVQVDTTIPTITAVATAPGSGSVAAGQIIAINVSTSEPVAVSGTPTLTLNDGGIATYDPANSTSTLLSFSYTVHSGDNTADLTVTGSNLNGGVIADGAGNALDLSIAVGNPAGILRVDTIAPTIIAVATQPGTGPVVVGQVVAIDVTPSEAISVSGGTPTLTLNDGGIATYDAATSTPTLMVFKYTVQAGQNTADLTVTAGNLNGASISDAAGNPLDLSGAIGNPPGILQVTTVPVVTSVIVAPATADLAAGSNILFQVNTNEPVTITGGIPTLALNTGGTAVYDAASSSPTLLIFRHTVQAGENTPDLAITAAMLNGATITDSSGQIGSLDGAIGNPAGILQIDTIAPTALSIVETRSLQSGTFQITGNFSEPVTIAGGPPQFTLSNGASATYNPLLSTPFMGVYTYTAPAGQSIQDLTVTGFQTNGATAVDGAGNALDVPSIVTALASAQGNVADVTGISPTTIDVYRFFDTRTGTHFYTQDPAERANVLATRPDLVPEGTNGVGLTAVDPASNDPNAVAVYRFFDRTLGTHFFTASATERDAVIATRQDLVYEPSSTFYEHTQPQAGDTAVYRFFDQTYGTHFYTDSPTERASILQSRPDLVSEGIGFYEPARNPAT